MTCFELRRLLLAPPRDKTAEQQEHLARCSRCAALAGDAAAFEARLQEAMLVPAPDALADKILLRQKMRPPMRHGLWAMPATLVIGLGLGVQLYRVYDAGDDNVRPSAALTHDHPAVAAISYVLDHEPRLLQENRSGDPLVMRAAFLRLGLRLPADSVSVRYLGKCPVPGGTGEHVVLMTPYGQATLILVPDYPVGSRVLVADRQITAVASPLGNGG